ncbi:50S ribosomal protein L2 [Candidatus Fokinia solitaria]|uniref:Large ribosomal subunit protein uL2 n=1 Tax=Candidatus Fokinia solitaria TaxID=1802984 RepID=A0A2U8BRI6_9RICK|nr:50S ribosomal protein L2 [Candidatus Fokinia solitaria]AWD32947.1 50S ribosomal protein L2 [Candidatus Fokinia solitaria]
MSLKFYRPMCSSTRGLVSVARDDLWAGKPFKGLVTSLNKSGGRNNMGRITVRHKGGGHKVKYRIIDFKRRKLDVQATVERLEYDPNRTSFIALIKYSDGEYSYIIAPHNLKVGDTVISSDSAEIKVGNTLPLGKMPSGTVVHNIELKPNKGGQLVRSAGCSAMVTGSDGDYVLVRLKSGKATITRKVLRTCFATVGVVSNQDNRNIKFAKAGRKRWMGVRPTVRGVAMNPVDHPHGGGEGKTSGGRHPVTPWGKGTKGLKTRKNKRTDKFIVHVKNK